jgi:hypothetical protein
VGYEVEKTAIQKMRARTARSSDKGQKKAASKTSPMPEKSIA